MRISPIYASIPRGFADNNFICKSNTAHTFYAYLIVLDLITGIQKTAIHLFHKARSVYNPVNVFVICHVPCRCK